MHAPAGHDELNEKYFSASENIGYAAKLAPILDSLSSNSFFCFECHLTYADTSHLKEDKN